MTPVHKPSSLAEKGLTNYKQHVKQRTVKQGRGKWAHFAQPFSADINQTALKRWMTRILPRGTQEPLCKVRQLGETRHMWIKVKTTPMLVLPLKVLTDRCRHILSGPIMSKDKGVVNKSRNKKGLSVDQKCRMVEKNKLDQYQ